MCLLLARERVGGCRAAHLSVSVSPRPLAPAPQSIICAHKSRVYHFGRTSHASRAKGSLTPSPLSRRPGWAYRLRRASPGRRPCREPCGGKGEPGAATRKRRAHAPLPHTRGEVGREGLLSRATPGRARAFEMHEQDGDVRWCDAGNPRSLAERARLDALKLLSRFAAQSGQ